MFMKPASLVVDPGTASHHRPENSTAIMTQSARSIQKTAVEV